MGTFVDDKIKLTYQDYRHFPDDGRRHEIIDGEHYVSPSPSTNHQNASRHIQFALYEQIERSGRGHVFNAPMDLELAPVDVVQPDLIVVLDEQRHIVLPSRIRGVPDLLVEILSPSTSERDQTLKRKLYESHGVPEYWIVDVDEQVVHRFILDKGRYGEAEDFHDTITFAGATVDLTDVWRRV
jgi:Uma2 family endonuclease